MTIQMYDLAGADPALRFSPYCWRIRMALAHKELPVRCIPWRFTEKERIAFSGQGLVPVIVDGDKVVHDSWKIAQYLEATYPDRPSLFGDNALAQIRFEAEAVIRQVFGPEAVLHELVDIEAEGNLSETELRSIETYRYWLRVKQVLIERAGREGERNDSD